MAPVVITLVMRGLSMASPSARLAESEWPITPASPLGSRSSTAWAWRRQSGRSKYGSRSLRPEAPKPIRSVATMR